MPMVRSVVLVAVSVLSGASAFVSVAASAAEMDVERRQHCERRGVSRLVELRETPGGGLPCEVVYLKPDEGGSADVLWRASADRAFCTARFEAFVVKLESKLEWRCEAAVAAAAAVEGETPTETARVPSETRTAEPAQAVEVSDHDAPAIAVPRDGSRGESMTGRQGPDAPELEAAVPAPLGRSVTPAASDTVLTPFERLRSVVPAGRYAAVPTPSNERGREERVAPWCPPAGALSWREDGPSRAVFSLGDAIEFVVRLPDAPLGERFVLPIVSSVGAGATRELQTLSPAADGVQGEGRGRAEGVDDGRRAEDSDEGASRDGGGSGVTASIDIRVAPRGPGSGALSPAVCRYAFEE